MHNVRIKEIPVDRGDIRWSGLYKKIPLRDVFNGCLCNLSGLNLSACAPGRALYHDG